MESVPAFSAPEARQLVPIFEFSGTVEEST